MLSGNIDRINRADTEQRGFVSVKKPRMAITQSVHLDLSVNLKPHLVDSQTGYP